MKKFRTKILVSVSTALLAGCASTGSTKDSENMRGPASNASGDSWGPIVELNDNTGAFPDQKPNTGWWVTGIHATLRPDGFVLMTGWGRRDHDNCQSHGSRKNGTTFLLDPSRLQPPVWSVMPINEQGAGPADVLYCAGFTPIKGAVFYTGGATYQNLGDPFQQKEWGLPYARMYNPQANQFTRIDSRMTEGPQGAEGVRWYPTNTRLADGRVLVTGGLTFCCGDQYQNLSIQAFHPDMLGRGNPWTTLARQNEGWRDITIGLKDYTHVFLLPEPVPAGVAGGLTRQVAMMGYQGKLIYMNTDEGVPGSQRFTMPPHAQRPSGPAWDATAALLGTGEIMTFGGTSDPGGAQRADLYYPPKDSWRSINLGIGRDNSSSVLLPDGTVLIINGSDGSPQLPGDRRMPQILDPYSGEFFTFAPAQGETLERGYHNFALLLKDGSILTGGGTSASGGIGCERTDLRIYYPWYFSKGPRPEILAPEPIRMVLGGSQPVTIPYRGPALRCRRSGSTGPCTGGVALMALGAFTHSFDQNQRYIPLNFQVAGDGSLQIQPPQTGFVAPAGDYILYLISEAGAPSVGRYVQVGP